MNPYRTNEPKVKVAVRSESVSREVVALLGLVVLLIGVCIGL